MMNDELGVVHPRAAGLDIHKGHITPTVRLCEPTGGEYADEGTMPQMRWRTGAPITTSACATACASRTALTGRDRGSVGLCELRLRGHRTTFRYVSTDRPVRPPGTPENRPAAEMCTGLGVCAAEKQMRQL